MSKPPNRRLKVFWAELGFYETIIAAPSQAAALRAWGVHQNLFAGGQARVTDDTAAVKAALAHPGTPLKRAIGSNVPFGLDAKPPKVPDAPRRRPARARAAKARAEPPAKPPADRRALDAAEAALRRLDEARKDEAAGLRRRQAELDAARTAAQEAYIEARKAAKAALVAARKAYRDAGGAD